MATQILAELGADVIKVERPGGGDESRSFAPAAGAGESAYFFAFNRGKRSITLDLKTPRGQEIARDLASRVDVVIENFLPGTMDEMGLGYTDVEARNPDVVYVSLSGFGQTGPYRDRRGYDTVFQALSGMMSLTGQPSGPPVKSGFPSADMTSGLWLVIAVLCGVTGRAANGHGTHVDLAMMDVQVSLLALAAARMFALDEDPVATGSEHPGRVPSAAFECGEGGWIQISGSDQHWPALCEVLGLDELAAEPELRDNSGRLEQRARVMDALRAAIAGRRRSELADALRSARVPVGEVNTVREILTDPHTQARAMVGSFDHPAAGRFPALRNPLRLTGFDEPEVQSPPTLGAHTDTVLRDLGLQPTEIEQLHREGVV